MKRALGRGLGALLPPRPETAEPEGGGGRVLDLPLDDIAPNPQQPRRHFDETALGELAASIRASGLLQPVVVRPSGAGRYELLVGERRWRAARLAGVASVPALVREATDAEALELALVENVLREDLNPMEEAEAYQRLLTDYRWTQDDLAGRLGKDRSSVANVLRLLRLPSAIQEDLRRGRLTMGHARALLAAPAAAEQLALRDRILAEAWSVRQTEARAGRTAPRSRAGRRRHPDLDSLEEGLRQALGARVRLLGSATRGRIEVVYSSEDELHRLYELLTDARGGAPVPIG
jgi:ParB family chromosome partitioning protein